MKSVSVSVSMVGPITDYQARGQELKDLNFMEFCLLINKCDFEVQKEMGAAAVVDDGIDDADVDDDDVDDNANSSCEDADEDHNNLAATSVKHNIQNEPISRRGPASNRRFPIQHCNETLLVHPQLGSKEFMIRSKVKVPLLIGRHVPHYPSSGIR